MITWLNISNKSGNSNKEVKLTASTNNGKTYRRGKLAVTDANGNTKVVNVIQYNRPYIEVYGSNEINGAGGEGYVKVHCPYSWSFTALPFNVGIQYMDGEMFLDGDELTATPEGGTTFKVLFPKNTESERTYSLGINARRNDGTIYRSEMVTFTQGVWDGVSIPVTYNLDNSTFLDAPQVVKTGDVFSYTIYPNSGYRMSDVQVFVNVMNMWQEITGTWDSETNEVSFTVPSCDGVMINSKVEVYQELEDNPLYLSLAPDGYHVQVNLAYPLDEALNTKVTWKYDDGTNGEETITLLAGVTTGVLNLSIQDLDPNYGNYQLQEIYLNGEVEGVVSGKYWVYSSKLFSDKFLDEMDYVSNPSYDNITWGDEGTHKPQYRPDPLNYYIRLTPATMDLEKQAGEYDFLIESNTAYIITAPDWIALSNTSGKGDVLVHFSVLPNTEYNRTGSIRVYDAMSDISKEVSVSQAGEKGEKPSEYFTLESGIYDAATNERFPDDILPADGGGKFFKIFINTNMNLNDVTVSYGDGISFISFISVSEERHSGYFMYGTNINYDRTTWIEFRDSHGNLLARGEYTQKGQKTYEGLIPNLLSFHNRDPLHSVDTKNVYYYDSVTNDKLYGIPYQASQIKDNRVYLKFYCILPKDAPITVQSNTATNLEIIKGDVYGDYLLNGVVVFSVTDNTTGRDKEYDITINAFDITTTYYPSQGTNSVLATYLSLNSGIYYYDKNTQERVYINSFPAMGSLDENIENGYFYVRYTSDTHHGISMTEEQGVIDFYGGSSSGEQGVEVNGVMYFKVAPNYSDSPRDITVTLTAGRLKEYTSLSQSAVTPSKTVSEMLFTTVNPFEEEWYIKDAEVEGLNGLYILYHKSNNGMVFNGVAQNMWVYFVESDGHDSAVYRDQYVSLLRRANLKRFDGMNIPTSFRAFYGIFRNSYFLKTVNMTNCFNRSREGYSQFSYYDMFNNCYSLESVDLSTLDFEYTTASGMNRMFYNCVSLKTIKIGEKGGLKDTGTDMFNNVPSGGTLYYPAGVDISKWMQALPSGWTAVAY